MYLGGQREVRKVKRERKVYLSKRYLTGVVLEDASRSEEKIFESSENHEGNNMVSM